MNKDRTPANERQAIYITTIKGVQSFYLVTVDPTRFAITETRGPASEADFRGALESEGIPPHETDSLIANAQHG